MLFESNPVQFFLLKYAFGLDQVQIGMKRGADLGGFSFDILNLSKPDTLCIYFYFLLL